MIAIFRATVHAIMTLINAQLTSFAAVRFNIYTVPGVLGFRSHRDSIFIGKMYFRLFLDIWE